MTKGTSTARPRALLIDGCSESRDRVSEQLTRSGYEVTAAVNGRTYPALQRARPQLVVCRLESGDPSGLLREHGTLSPAQILMYTEKGRPGDIARALRAGVEGVYEFPSEMDALCESARRLAPRVANALSVSLLQHHFLGAGRAIARVRDQVLALSQLRVPVLLRGEPGSGRRHTANLICGPLEEPIGVLASDAPTRMLREPCSFLLRDVDAFSHQAQGFWAKTLRDGTKVRVLASSSQDLAQLAAEERFDAELLQALARFEIRLPPLRERREDIPALAERLCEQAREALGRPQVRLTRSALTALQREPWPDNLRGLRRLLEKAVAFASGGVVGVRDVRALLAEGSESVDGLRSARERENKDALIRELRQAGGNLAEVGRALGISRGAVIYRAQKYGLLPEPRRNHSQRRRPPPSSPREA